MGRVSSMRLTAPKAAAGEIVRKELIDAVMGSQRKLTCIHAGAGYGKTTLLSQIASSRESTVWLSLDGEKDVFTFVDTLIEAVRRPFPAHDFAVSEYLPFEGKENFITILGNALISSIEMLSKDFLIIIDDLHTVEDPNIKNLITCFIKYMPENIPLCLGSREAPWQELIPLRLKGKILELTQKELAFTRKEAIQVLGFDDQNIFCITEGWPLAIGSFKVLLENGVSLVDIPTQGNEGLYSYLFYECISRLSAEMVDFLKTTACIDELDPQMLDAVLGKKNTKLILESLVSRNIFTIKTGTGEYRYHALFKKYLLEDIEGSEKPAIQNKAAFYYYENKEYSNAVKYAILSEDKAILEQIILASYREYIRKGNFSELRVWFQALGETSAEQSRELLVAKGAHLSSIGYFSEAKRCLDTVIPLLSENDNELYLEAMLHMARVLRNYISFEESNKLLDKLVTNIDNLALEELYKIMIEKIYNLCWNCQINEAYTASYQMIELCARAGNLKVKAWFERYLTAIHFFAGRMKDTIYFYEKSLELPEDEGQYLDIHNIGIYAAKAYQLLGEQDKALSIISTELQKLRSTGRYEELWAAYLLAAEIYYNIVSTDRRNGGSQTYEIPIKYFSLADEYAPLYRTTKFQVQWAKMQRLVCSLTFSNGPQEAVIKEILTNLDEVNDYLKTIVLGRLFIYYTALSDFQNTVKYAKLAIEVGERSNIMMIPTIAYGILAGAAITFKDYNQAFQLTTRFLKHCFEYGIYEFFKIKQTYGPILEFALDNRIEPDFTQQMMVFADYKIKKAYICTLGEFSIFPYKDRLEPLKMRAKKERELLAFLLDAGCQGVTKEQIYNAIWSESESKDVKKLIGVNLAHIKKDLAGLGIENPILKHGKYYSLCKDEIECDIKQFEKAVEGFKLQNSKELAQKILSLYEAEYLSDFEAFWATAKRINYREAYEEAVSYCATVNLQT